MKRHCWRERQQLLQWLLKKKPLVSNNHTRTGLLADLTHFYIVTESRLLNSEFPLELIIEVSKSLDIKGKLALRATCKAINNFLTDTRLGLKFVSSHRPISEPPYPHLLLAVTAGQLADWAVKSSRNELLLRGAMKESGDFVELALRVVRVTFGDWIKMQEMRATILRPLAQIVPQKPEAEAWNLKYGRNWYSSFWQEMALTKYLIYCGLFHHSFDNLLNDNAPGPLSIETRNAFFRWLNDEDDVYGSHFLNVLTCDTFKKVLDFLPNLESVESKGVQRLRCILLTHSGENWLRLVTLSIDPESEDWREGRCYIDVQPIHNIESEQWIKDLYAKVLAKIAIGGDLTLNWEKWELETVIQSRREWEGTTRSKQMSRWRLMCKVKV